MQFSPGPRSQIDQLHRMFGSMGFRVALVVLGLFAAVPAQADTQIRRTTLLVENLARSIEFYSALGLTPWLDRAAEANDEGGIIGGSDLPLSADPRDSRLVIMRGGDPLIGMIGLLSYEKPPLANKRSNLLELGVGDIIIMVEVDSMSRVFSALNDLDVRFHSEPYSYEVMGADGQPQTGRRMFVYDPDGHLIEVADPDER